MAALTSSSYSSKLKEGPFIELMKHLDLITAYYAHMKCPQEHQELRRHQASTVKRVDYRIMFGDLTKEVPNSVFVDIVKHLNALCVLDLRKVVIKPSISLSCIEVLFTLKNLSRIYLTKQNFIDVDLEMLTPKHSGILFLNISDASITDYQCNKLVSCFPRLRTYVARYLEIEGTHLMSLPPSITTVDITSSFMERDAINDMLAKPSIKLSNLSMAYNNPSPGVNMAYTLTNIFEHVSLVELTINYNACSNELRYDGIGRLVNLKTLIIDAPPRFFLNSDLVEIATTVTKNLKRFCIRYYVNGHWYLTLQDEALRVVFQNMDQLAMLEVEGADSVSSVQVKYKFVLCEF